MKAPKTRKSAMNRPLARKSGIVVQETEDEVLVYDLNTSKAYCLNKTCTLVWHLCDGENTISVMSEKISVQVGELVSEDFVLLAVDQLDKDGLLTGEFEPNKRFAGLSRREIIRRVGFSSAIALPIVSSLVAPKAANAQSGGGVGALCTGTGAQGSCNAGMICNPASTVAVFFTPMLTGDDRCCVSGVTNGNIISGTFCTNNPGGCAAIITCGGPATPVTPQNPTCAAAMGFITCQAT